MKESETVILNMTKNMTKEIIQNTIISNKAIIEDLQSRRKNFDLHIRLFANEFYEKMTKLILEDKNISNDIEKLKEEITN